MSDKKYNVCLSVPLGERDGILYINESNGKITGWLEVMKQRNSLCGSLSADGHISFEGEIETLLSRMHYTATGIICGQKIHLSLKTAADAYYSVSGEEITIDEENL